VTPDENGNVEIEVGASGGSAEWRLIKTIEITEDTAQITVTKDEDGNPFSLEEMRIDILNNQAASTATGAIYCQIQTSRRYLNDSFTTTPSPKGASFRTVFVDTPAAILKFSANGAGNGWSTNVTSNTSGASNTKISSIVMRASASSLVAFGAGFKCTIWGR
jgi:hypothetical protein